MSTPAGEREAGEEPAQETDRPDGPRYCTCRQTCPCRLAVRPARREKREATRSESLARCHRRSRKDRLGSRGEMREPGHSFHRSGN